jgi:TonB family protein
MKRAEKRARLGVVAILFVALTACVSSHIRGDAPQRVNAVMEKREQGDVVPPSPYHDQILRLWRDKPDAEALLATKAKRIRIISAVAPAYPLSLRLGHVNGRVLMTFIVETDGRVKEAQILESSDERFNDSALEAIRRFTFLPAEGPLGPVQDLVSMPIYFAWSKKQLPNLP